MTDSGVSLPAHATTRDTRERQRAPRVAPATDGRTGPQVAPDTTGRTGPPVAAGTDWGVAPRTDRGRAGDP